MSLKEYHRKRDFEKTSEPRGDASPRSIGSRFVVQKHAASRLHYDFRLELDGVLKSWAVPKGPSLDPGIRSLAVHVEDHPVEYGSFEGIIPAGQYGGGTVMVWDQGDWSPKEDPAKGYRQGKLKFDLHGSKLQGGWTLVRMRGKDEDADNWLLIKERDETAQPGDQYGLTERSPLSVVTARDLDQIAADADRVWTSQGEQAANGKRAQASARHDSPFDVSWSQLPGARKARLPKVLAPQLATLTTEAPAGDEWLHELKLDGYRILAHIRQGRVRLITRTGQDWTQRFEPTASALGSLPLPDGMLDGELVSLDSRGVSDFQRLQNSMQHDQANELVYYAFDLPFADGYDLRQVPLELRKQCLAQVVKARFPANTGPVRYSDHIAGQGEAMFEQSCARSLEGIVSKRRDSTYESGRTPTWLKTKCHRRQEFVIGGYSKPQGSREAFGALLLGYYQDEQLTFCGRVGTGFTADSLHALGKQLRDLKTKEMPFDPPPSTAQRRDVTWVMPELIAEVAFSGWTEDGMLRHPSFQGLRADKAPTDIVREEPALPSAPQESRKTQTRRTGKRPMSETIAGVRISNPDRVVYPDVRLTKLQIAEYYEQVADWILPELIERPLTLVRCPQGQAGKCFYQKHLTDSLPDAVQGVPIEEKSGADIYVYINDIQGLISLVQMGVLEFHPWGARIDRLDRPDRVVFDLDPAEDVAWDRVKQAATAVKARLGELGLKSFLRTSGGKGLHVVVPLTRRNSWEEVYAFAQHIAVGFARNEPDNYVANMRKQLRHGKVFLDYFRNNRGATSIASYSTRSRAGAPVATPLDWKELEKLTAANQYHVQNLPSRLAQLKTAPWAELASTRQSITAEIARGAERFASGR